jgi:hypothetical protein
MQFFGFDINIMIFHDVLVDRIFAGHADIRWTVRVFRLHCNGPWPNFLGDFITDAFSDLQRYVKLYRRQQSDWHHAIWRNKTATHFFFIVVKCFAKAPTNDLARRSLVMFGL